VKLNLFVSAQYPAGEDMTERMRNHVHEVQIAHDAGFSGIAVGQHLSVNDLQWAPPLPLASHLVGKVPGIDVNLAVLLLPYFNPFLLAESVAFLDTITEGTLRVGIAPGWAEREFRALGVDKDRRFADFRVKAEIFRSLLRGDAIDIEGPSETESFRLGLLPREPQGPLIQLGTSGPKSARNFAGLVDTLVMSGHIPLMKQLPIREAFLNAKRELGESVGPMSINRHVMIGESREKILQEAASFLTKTYSKLDDWGLFSGVLNEEASPQQFEEVVLERVIIGNPDDVVTGLNRVRKKLGVDTINVSIQWDGMPSGYVERAIQLIGREVLPYLDS